MNFKFNVGDIVKIQNKKAKDLKNVNNTKITKDFYELFFTVIGVYTDTTIFVTHQLDADKPDDLIKLHLREEDLVLADNINKEVKKDGEE